METTSKRAALDAWLVAAEDVLRDQREHSISPSTVEIGREAHDERSAALEQVERGLEAVLRGSCSTRVGGSWCSRTPAMLGATSSS